MSLLGKTLVVKGEVLSKDDITIEGRVEGPVSCEGAAVTIASTATIVGDLIARDVTVMGQMSGQIVATEVVDVRVEGAVTGKVVAERFILNEGATFNGRVEPQHLEAALRVARFQREKKSANGPTAAAAPARVARRSGS